MLSLLAQGAQWDIRGLFHFITWPWIVAFMIAYVLSGVQVYIKLRKARDKSVASRKVRRKARDTCYGNV
jgi:hypothetical protein